MSVPNFIDGKFILGANLAWLDGQYQRDLGKNPTLGIDKPAYDDPVHKANMNSYLQDMANMGIQVVRLWVFEKFEGLLFDNQGFVSGVDQSLVDNLADVCRIASDCGLKFYLCMMDTETIWQDSSPKRSNHVNIMNGLINVPEKTNSYLKNAVIPLISDNRIKNNIFAIDVLNEPEGIDNANSNSPNAGPYRMDTGITREQLMSFIKACADSIKANTGLKVSCGFEGYQSIQNDQFRLGDHLDFFDIHRYSDTWDIPDWSSLGINKPCIIGECGQKDKPWDNVKQQNVANMFLNNALSKGYAGCFLWNYNYKGFTDPDGNYLSLINGDGSRRPVCSMIRDFADTIAQHEI